MKIERFFNTAGPNKKNIHYYLHPLQRWDLEEIEGLIHQQKYVVLHAPRQTGKTTCMLELAEHLNNEGIVHAVYSNIEVAQSARENVGEAIAAILRTIYRNATTQNTPHIPDFKPHLLSSPHDALANYLTEWAEASPKPIALFLDEVDSLVGDTLISVLRQIRSGYDSRPGAFPQSIILCGVRDVRDYRMRDNDNKSIITGGSAFNIKAESLSLGNFTQEEITQLYNEHTKTTGQKFDNGILEVIFNKTHGQPWLVNALAYELTHRNKRLRKDRSITITVEDVIEASNNLILRRDTHLDQLSDKMSEDRVRRVIEPLLASEYDTATVNPDDAQYCMDLGLIRKERGSVTISNEIYREILPRDITSDTQDKIASLFDNLWYVDEHGHIDAQKLFTDFQTFYGENASTWLPQIRYTEAAPQLLMQAYLQRIANGEGRVEREYAASTRRVDLCLIWPLIRGEQRRSTPPHLRDQKIVVELKVRRKESIEALLEKGLPQTAAYGNIMSCDNLHLIIFDKNLDRPANERVFKRQESYEGVAITVWGM